MCTLEDNKCIPKHSSMKSKSVMADLIDVKTRLQGELKDMTTI